MAWYIKKIIEQSSPIIKGYAIFINIGCWFIGLKSSILNSFRKVTAYLIQWLFFGVFLLLKYGVVFIKMLHKKFCDYITAYLIKSITWLPWKRWQAITSIKNLYVMLRNDVDWINQRHLRSTIVSLTYETTLWARFAFIIWKISLQADLIK